MLTLRTIRRAALILPLLASAALAQDAARAVPTPESRLGFQPGADFKLASWETVVEYFQTVGAGSDRVQVQTLGESTEGRPFVVAVVSSPETIADLPRYQKLQHQLADPRRIGPDEDPAEVVAASKPVVLITCTIHSSETASTLMAMELLHELATKDDAATREILDRTILLLVPSVNPDGVDKVADWYERSLDTPWEGGGMPWLYHLYAGHDTNRDWFMLNLQETRLLTRMLYRDWFPTITYDVHQMGSAGARLFVPPFFDPVNPNLDPRLSQSIALIGTHMAADLARAGKTGVLTNAMYDNWWNGGNRTVPQRHNMVGILTEAASVRLASPIFLDQVQLRGASRGFANHDPAVNFVQPWPGGWWRLRDIVEYELICARSVLTLAARYRDEFQDGYRAMASDAIKAGDDEPPHGWVVPSDGADPGRAADLVRILHETGIDIHRADEPFEAAGRTVPAGSWVLPAAQPYRPHLKDMMERQVYPTRLTDRGEPEAPYDVAGWTLPLQMGVESFEVREPFEIPGAPLAEIPRPAGVIEGVESPRSYVIDNRADDDFRVLNALLAVGIPVRIATGAYFAEGSIRPAGSLWIKATPEAREILEASVEKFSSRVTATSRDLDEMTDDFDLPATQALRAPRIGLYQPWVPSMDEGWTRLVLENFDFPYSTLHNADIRAGGLDERFDAIVIPAVGGGTIRNGYRPNATEPEYVGGLGQEGADALQDFLRTGGTVVCLEQSSLYAISTWELPVKELLSGRPRSQFYGPGSILRVVYEDTDSVGPTMGMPERGHAYFNRSLAFEAESGSRVLARYASSDVLTSGWLFGASALEGKAAVVSVAVGEGEVVLFGFPPQHRGQSRGTFRLLFNTLVAAALEQDRTARELPAGHGDCVGG